MLDSRELQLIDLLNLQDGYVSPEEICTRLDIRMRTLQKARKAVMKSTGT